MRREGRVIRKPVGSKEEVLNSTGVCFVFVPCVWLSNERVRARVVPEGEIVGNVMGGCDGRIVTVGLRDG